MEAQPRFCPVSLLQKPDRSSPQLSTNLPLESRQVTHGSVPAMYSSLENRDELTRRVRGLEVAERVVARPGSKKSSGAQLWGSFGRFYEPDRDTDVIRALDIEARWSLPAGLGRYGILSVVFQLSATQRGREARASEGQRRELPKQRAFLTEASPSPSTDGTQVRRAQATLRHPSDRLLS